MNPALLRSIIESAGAQWVGVQTTDGAPLILFRDPVTGSTCGLREEHIDADHIAWKLGKIRAKFGARIS